MLTNHFIKQLSFIFFISISLVAKAQQVQKIDCCKDINIKAVITINDNTAALTTPFKSPQNASFNFELTTSVSTSAGVYNTDGNLIRTLWSGVHYEAGCYVGQWDGLLDDDSTLAPFGKYTVKVQTAQTTATWGLIGNTSTDKTGDFVLKTPPFDMCFIGTIGFATAGYSEHGAPLKTFNISDPNKYTSPPYSVTTQSTYRLCTDGNIVYCAGNVGLGYDLNHNVNQNDWVYGTYVSDNANPSAKMVPFAAGVVEDSFNSGTGTVHYDYALSDTKQDYRGFINSICVQKTGNKLFVARALMNQLQVIDKRVSSGALLQTLTYQNIKAVQCDDNNHLYLVYAGNIHKATINDDGTLTDLGVSFFGLQAPSCVDVSPDGNTIAVGDSVLKQVKFYSTTGGNPTATLGQLNGYATNPLVANDKFWNVNFIKYQPDGSFWVGDNAYDGFDIMSNSRVVHFNADKTYHNQIQGIISSRSTHVDQDRYFADFLEFRRDRSKPLDNGQNGSWKFYANWGKNIQGYDDFQRFGQVFPGDNRFYATAGGKVYELIESTGARLTSAQVHNVQRIGKDGTLFNTIEINPNDPQNDKLRAIQITAQDLSFDANHDPVWGSPSNFVTSPAGDYYGLYSPARYMEYTQGISKSSPRYIYFSNNNPYLSTTDLPKIGYHLGSIKKGGNQYEWQTMRSTATDYQGDVPVNGDWDIGNGWPGQHSETHASMADDNYIFVPQNNEFYKAGLENNIINVFSKDGLFVTQFGITGAQAALLGNSPAQLAGNNFGSDLTKTGDGIYHMTLSDESVHGAICVFDVDLSSVNTVSIPIVVSKPITTATDPADLMAGLPFRSANFTGGNGWSFNRPPDANFSAQTSALTYTKDNIDLLVKGSSNSESYVMKSLGQNNTNNYSLTGKVAWLGNPGYASYDGVFYDVLDANGKVLARLDVTVDSGNGYLQSIKINGITVKTDYQYLGSSGFIKFLQPFSMTNINGKVTFNYAGYSQIINTSYDKGGDFTKPANFKIKVFSSRAQQDISELKFLVN